MQRRLRPEYAEKFRCIGAQCEDNCCHDWQVTIDKGTYQKYQATPALRVLLDEHIELTGSAELNNFASFKNRPSDNCCPMLASDGLCTIHKEHGHEYLPFTCASYPRNPMVVDDVTERPLFLSCPEAARLVLLDPHLTPQLDDANRQYLLLQQNASDLVSAIDDVSRTFWQIRELCLLLVHDRLYPLWQRLYLLGVFCKRLEAMIYGGQVAAVPQLICKYAEIAAQGGLRSAMDGIPARVSVQVEMLLQVVQQYLVRQDPRLSRINECLQDFLEGTGGDNPETSLDCRTRHYIEGYERYYAPFMEQHPFLLENYLTNYMFAVRFPLRAKLPTEVPRPQNEFLLLCVEFAVIKGLLIGIAGRYREEFAPVHVVKLIQAVAKSIEHSTLFRSGLNWPGLSDANSIAALLKN
jgi:lysine-N-methylase